MWTGSIGHQGRAGSINGDVQQRVVPSYIDDKWNLPESSKHNTLFAGTITVACRAPYAGTDNISAGPFVGCIWCRPAATIHNSSGKISLTCCIIMESSSQAPSRPCSLADEPAMQFGLLVEYGGCGNS
jgi:hypothetical protein